MTERSEKQVTSAWFDEDGTEYMMVPRDIWEDVLARAGGATVSAQGGGLCAGHGGVASSGSGWVCCADGHCFTV